MPAKLYEVADYLTTCLNHSEISDYSGAQNGLQLENTGHVDSFACAVDANVITLGEAAQSKNCLLIVHHGLAWTGLCPLVGKRYTMIKNAIGANLAVFSSHLPLDAHPEFGNNRELTRLLGFTEGTPCLDVKGTPIAQKIKTSIARDELAAKLKQTLGPTQIIPAGSETCKNILISTGSGNSLLSECARLQIDTVVTGEISHDNFSLAHDLEINVLLGGHYATETLGVKALTQHLSETFKLPWTFIDAPSGL